MHADHTIRGEPPDLGSDTRAHIASLHRESVVTEPSHQLEHHRGDVAALPVASDQWCREAESRMRRDHDIERIGRVTAVGDRIGQTPTEPPAPETAPRPA